MRRCCELQVITHIVIFRAVCVAVFISVRYEVTCISFSKFYPDVKKRYLPLPKHFCLWDYTSSTQRVHLKIIESLDGSDQ